MHVFGGERCINGIIDTSNDLWIYSFGNQSWKEVQIANPPPPRVGSRAVAVNSNYKWILVAGLTLQVSPQWEPKDWLNDTWALTN
jgi:hypothetical protein